QAQAQYDELKKDFDTTLIGHKSEIRILEFTRDRHVRHRERHAHDIVKFTMNAPMPGLVVMQTFWRSGEMAQVQQGDQVAPNQPFMKVVDTSHMLVDASVNQVESEFIRIGQSASVVFDAFPALRLKAKVKSVGALASGGWRQNYYVRNVPISVAIEGSDPRIIPDLSAAVDVVLTEKPDSLLIPLEAVQSENGRNVVFVKENGQFRPREVELGPKNHIQTVVVSGLKAGEVIALQRPPNVQAS
ncbi:MAG: HlyD family efflux transporter periplasmic adaptor subunit, partial [Acidobacteria bacterium]|nr:HlyD family efflux transporter periplasmic adaptor subunit [Acidobacteriota bacterium]